MDPRFPKSVVFITEPVNVDGEVLFDPIGTGFVLRATELRCQFEYVVTARHVVEGRRNVHVKVRRADGSLHDIEAGDWVYHETDAADLAISILAVQPSDYSYSPVPLSLPHGTSYLSSPRGGWHDTRAGYAGPNQVGDLVYFMGLLAPVPRMGDEMVPFVRSGIIGALNQEQMPVQVQKSEDNPLGLERVDGHLIDAHGQEGFSGSPCFVWKDVEDREEFTVRLAERQRMTGRDYRKVSIPRSRPDPRFFGVFLGYFWVAPDGRPINSGIGIVAPKARVVELLMQPKLVAHRAPRVDEVKRQNEEIRRKIGRERQERERARADDDGDGA